MYKVFFKDRVMVLTSRIEKDLTPDFNAIFKYSNQGELKKFIQNFERNDAIKTAIIYWHNERELLQFYRDCYKNILAAGGLVWNQKADKFLVFKRLGFVDLPKGKIEKEETFEQAALREVTEECGLNELEIFNRLATTYHTYYIGNQPIFKETRWFEMRHNGNGSLTAQTEEHIESIWWVTPEEFNSLINFTYPSVLQVLSSSERLHPYIKKAGDSPRL